MSEFTDQVILVTGAGKGIGRAVAEAFAAQGAIIAANDVTPINLDETVRRVQASGGRIQDYIFDVAKRMPTEAMIDHVLEDWKRIDVLINCAGVRPSAPILDMDEWDWARTLEVNLGGPFFTMQQAGRAMRVQGQGSIVNFGDPAWAASSQPNLAAYLASKAGLEGLTRAAAREFAAYGIRVNMICLEGMKALPAEQGAILSGELLGPEQVAQVVVFLCSRASRPLTGQVLTFSSLAASPGEL